MDRVRVGVVGVGSMGRTYAGGDRRHRGARAGRALHADARPDRGPAGPEVLGPPGDDRVGARGRGRHRHAALEPSDRGDRRAPGGPPRPHRQAPRRPRGGRPADARRAHGQDSPVRRHLQRAHAAGDRQDPRDDPVRRARGAPPGHLARHRRLPLARLLRERRLAGDLGWRGRGRHHQPGLARPRPAPVVRGAARSASPRRSASASTIPSRSRTTSARCSSIRAARRGCSP